MTIFAKPIRDKLVSGPVAVAAGLILASTLAVAQSSADEPAPLPADDTSACPMADGEHSCPHAAGQHQKMHGHRGMHGGGQGGPEGMAMFERMGAELMLTDTQKQELAALFEMYRPRIKELWERGEASRRAVIDTAPNDPSYNTKATELSQQAGASAAEMVTLLTELQANAFALLTTDQQAKFLELRAEQRVRMEERRAEMEARREAGEPMHGKHKCKACKWLEEDDQEQADEAP